MRRVSGAEPRRRSRTWAAGAAGSRCRLSFSRRSSSSGPLARPHCPRCNTMSLSTNRYPSRRKVRGRHGNRLHQEEVAALGVFLGRFVGHDPPLITCRSLEGVVSVGVAENSSPRNLPPAAGTKKQSHTGRQTPPRGDRHHLELAASRARGSPSTPRLYRRAPDYPRRAVLRWRWSREWREHQRGACGGSCRRRSPYFEGKRKKPTLMERSSPWCSIRWQ